MNYKYILASLLAVTANINANENSAFAELDAEFEEPAKEKIIVKEKTVFVPITVVNCETKNCDDEKENPSKIKDIELKTKNRNLTTNDTTQNFNNSAYEIEHLSTSANPDKTKLITRVRIRNKLNNTTWLESYRAGYITDSNGNKWKLERYNSLRHEVQFTPLSSSMFQFVFNLENPPAPGEPGLSTFKEPLFYSGTLRYKLQKNREVFNVGFNNITLN